MKIISNRREFLRTMALASFSAAAIHGCSRGRKKPATRAGEKKPNVVFILADDMGWGDVESYNPDTLTPTPNINRLAGEGLSFTDAHSGGALCTPTRYGILTGRYYWRTHKKHSLVMPYDPPTIPPERMTWGRLMQEGGYQTAFIGKWHLGLWYPSKKRERWQRQYTMEEEEIDFSRPVAGGPCDLGFDYFFGTAGCSTSDAPYCFIRNNRWVGIPTEKTPEEMNDKPGVYPGLMVTGWDQETVDITMADEAVATINRFAETKPGQPFFLYYALSAPHIPWIAPESVRGGSREGPRGDMNALVDQCVGKIRACLENNGLLDDTILIFTSDNGPRRGANGQKSAGPYRGYKNRAYEGGHRIPFIIRWPGMVRGATRTDTPICLNDMMATHAALLDTSLPDDAAEDSINILPSILSEGKVVPSRPALISDTGGHVASLGDFSIRHKQWKLIEKNRNLSADSKTARYELYDLSNDPYESADLAKIRPQIVAEMKGLLGRCRGKGLRFVKGITQ